MKRTVTTLAADAVCEDCDYERSTPGSNSALGGAARHAKAQHHTVTVTVATEAVFDGKTHPEGDTK